MRNSLMAKKTARETSHLRVRIEPKLLARLEKSRERNGHTLTGEIVARLEQSFEKEDRGALVREAVKSAQLQAFPVREMVAYGAASFQSNTDEAQRAALVVDVLVGGEKRKSDFLRSVAVELATAPIAQLENASSRRQLMERVLAVFEERTAYPKQWPPNGVR
jgi:hypothetical protein